MSASETAQRMPTILSVDDEFGAVSHVLRGLRLEGCETHHSADLAGSRQYLAELDIQLVLLDAHIEGHDGGRRLITELKRGELGPRNIAAAFGFLTASRSWVDEEAMSALPGYIDTAVKASGETRVIMDWILQDPGLSADRWEAKLQRLPIRVAGVADLDGKLPVLTLSIPAWSVDAQLPYPVAALPPEMAADPTALVHRWYIAKMNLYEPDPGRIVVCEWEPQEPLDDE